jgi:hypothetical protein
MVANQVSAETVADLYEKLQHKRDKLQEQLDEVNTEFEAVATVLKLMGLPTPAMSSIDLTGMSHMDALIAIAKANDNLLVVKTARRLMTRAGMFKNPKNASSVIFTAIGRSGKFQPTDVRGRYKYVEQKEATPFKLPQAVGVA